MEQAFERRRWLLPLLLALATIIFLRPLIIPPQAGDVLDGNDYKALFYPLNQYNAQTLQSGELPLWNPHQFLGFPMIGEPHAALFYPGTWFLWLVGVQYGMGLVLVFHVWLGAWGMATLLRSFSASYTGSFLAGIIYGMSGWVGARLYVGHYNLLMVFGLMSWMLVAYRHALSRGTWRSTLPGMVATGLALLAGYPPLVLYAGLGLVSLWVFHVGQAYGQPEYTARTVLRAAWNGGLLLVMIVVGGIVLGAALVIPAVQLSSLSVRTQTDLTFANSYALPPAQYLNMIFPFLFGSPRGQPFYWGAEFFEEFTAYVGLLPLIAIPLALRRRRAVNWYFVGLIVFGLLLSIGIEGGVLPLLVWWVPAYSTFRVPARGLMFVVLGTAGLTALLVTALQNSTLDSRRKLLRPLVRTWIPLIIGALTVVSLFVAVWYSATIGSGDLPKRLFTASGSIAVAVVILLVVELVLWLWTDRDPRSVRFALLATVLLVTLDAWHVAIPIISVAPPPVFPLWDGARVNVPLGPDARVLAPNHFDDIASVTGHLDVQGYDPLPLATYDALHGASDPTNILAPINTLFGVKYLLGDRPYDDPHLELIGIAPGGTYYRRKDAFSRAWFASSVTVDPDDAQVRASIVKDNDPTRVYTDRAVDCPGAGSGTATISSYRPNDVSIQTNGAGGLLVLSDQFYPGWQAKVDGQTAPIYRADTALRGVCVPAGDHTVLFEFRPLALYVGLLLSAIGWLVVLTLSIGEFRRRKMPTPDAGAHPPLPYETP